MELNELKQQVKWIEAEVDSAEFRSEWGLGSSPVEFDACIEDRISSLICEYAIQNGISFEDACNELNKY